MAKRPYLLAHPNKFRKLDCVLAPRGASAAEITELCRKIAHSETCVSPQDWPGFTHDPVEIQKSIAVQWTKARRAGLI